MGKTDIEWTDRSWNPTVGCSKVSQGCKNCYAMSFSARIANSALARQQKGKELTDVEKAYMAIVKWESTGPEDSQIKAVPKWTGDIAVIESRLEEPLHIQKPQRFFVNSMTDLFHPNIEFALLDKLFAVMALCDQHTFQILTKRPERMKEYFTAREDASTKAKVMTQLDSLGDKYDKYFEKSAKIASSIPNRPYLILDNVWLGTSVENQETAEERIPELLACPANIRFLSCEPLLGALDLEYFFSDEAIFQAQGHNAWVDGGPGIHQCIVGAESGNGARAMDLSWARSIREQCKTHGTSFFMKQICNNGTKIKFNNFPEDLKIREEPNAQRKT